MRPFVGIGPGRCGTESLVRYVRSCGYQVTHEGFRSKWYKTEPRIRELAEKLKSGELHGDVNCLHFPHVAFLEASVPNLGVVCLHRSREKVVRSYMDNVKPCFRPVDKIRNYSGDKSEWAARYPFIDAATSKQSVEFWWEMCEEFMRGSKPNWFHMNTEDFNNDKRVHELYRFLKIPESDWKLPSRRKFNTTEQRRKMTKGELFQQAHLLGTEGFA